MCQWGADDYSDRYNKPSYAPGSTVCIQVSCKHIPFVALYTVILKMACCTASYITNTLRYVVPLLLHLFTSLQQYPAKNHVATPATDLFMPDTSFKIFRSVNPGEKPDSTSKMIELFNYNEKHVQGTIDYKGFQNCPGFPANNDKAVCTACFDVGATPATGEYMFVWEWFFNENLPPYTTCWDAFVGAGGGNMVNRPVGSTTTAIQAPQGSSTGGSTSNNNNSGSSSNNSGSSSNSGSGNAQDGGHPPNPNCEHGILDPASGACCASSCGSCGGDNCHAKEGGAECCCASLIKTTNRSCSHEIAPCMVDGFVPQTSSTPAQSAPVTPAAAPAPAPVPAVVTPPVPVPAAEPVPAVVAPVPETPVTPPAPASSGDVPPAAVVDNTPVTPAAPAPVPAPVLEDNSNNGNNNSGEQPQTPAEPAPVPAPVPEDNGNNNNNGGEQPQTPAEPAPAAPVVDTPVVVEPAPAAPVEDNSGSNNTGDNNNSSGDGDSAEAQASQDNSGSGISEDHSQ
jgi:hypothetical protein